MALNMLGVGSFVRRAASGVIQTSAKAVKSMNLCQAINEALKIELGRNEK